MITTGYKVSRIVILTRRNFFADRIILLIRYVFAKRAENVMPVPIISKYQNVRQVGSR